jgi:hypothetical protein
MSPAHRAENIGADERARRRHQSVIQGVLMLGMKCVFGSVMCWFDPEITRSQASV